MNDKQNKGYRIGEISEIKKIDKQTLRYYDRIGLLKPEIVDESNGYRYYSIEQFMDVDLINFHKHLGLTLNEMKKFRETRKLDESITTLKNQHDKLICKIQEMKEVEKNISKIIDEVQFYTDFLKDENYIVSEKSSVVISGIIGDSPNEKGIYNIELSIGSAIDKVDDEIGHFHNFGMYFEYNFESEGKLTLGETHRVIIPIEVSDQNYRNDKLSKLEISRHLEIIIKGGRTGFEKYKDEIFKWIKDNDYEVGNKVYIRSIVSSFIVNNDDFRISEMIIPLK